MSSHHKQRLEAHIQEILADLLTREAKDPRLQGLVITAVELNEDNSMAKVFVMSGEPGTHAALRKAAPFLRAELSRSLRTRTCPELRFAEDESLDRYNRIEDLLAEDGPEPAPGESLPAPDPDRPEDA